MQLTAAMFESFLYPGQVSDLKELVEEVVSYEIERSRGEHDGFGFLDQPDLVVGAVEDGLE